MVITVRAVLITLVPVSSFFAETLLAFLAGKGHFGALEESVLLGFGVALRTVEPFLACWREGEVNVENGIWRGEGTRK